MVLSLSLSTTKSMNLLVSGTTLPPLAVSSRLFFWFFSSMGFSMVNLSCGTFMKLCMSVIIS